MDNKIFTKIKLLSILLLVCSFSFLSAESKWIKLVKTDRDKALKEFGYENVEKASTTKFTYSKEIIVPYSM